jgi:hypothetical protein
MINTANTTKGILKQMVDVKAWFFAGYISATDRDLMLSQLSIALMGCDN